MNNKTIKYIVKPENRLKIADAIDEMPECDVRSVVIKGKEAEITVFFLAPEVILEVSKRVAELNA